jgi:hypothetical protein
LSGSIPAELGNLSNLHGLYLYSNRLSGSIPPELGNISNLKYLDLNSNRLSGSIPPELGNLSNLYTLDLNSNRLSGNILTNLTNLIHMYSLSIDNNCLYTDDPELITWLNRLNPGWETTQCVGEKNPPFGSFDTPIHGSTVYSSIPVTGWALDDYGIDSVKIYRKQGKTLVYIGDGVFVEGARPDVAAAYPGYPNNTKAGWGYMMLTNFLPNSGNGTFDIHAVVTDVAGKTTTLGTKTIHCDNANAVKPFGAIDTPSQGGTASGSNFINWGWVLTPQPNNIATDGSTIKVYVDGINLGHPNYNIYRSDIANLFPGCANSNGAAGYFNLDTTVYANGVHTIQWTAADSAGNTDGIGSRYFTIQNPGSSSANSMTSQMVFDIDQVSALPIDNTEPSCIVKGFNKVKSLEIAPDRRGLYRVEIEELERLKIILASKSNIIAGYVVSNGKLYSLPIGSTLRRGSFYWTPGPGFLGDFMLIFVLENQRGELTRREILVNIVPGKR